MFRKMFGKTFSKTVNNTYQDDLIITDRKVTASANVTVIGDLKDKVAALIPNTQPVAGEAFHYSYTVSRTGKLTANFQSQIKIPYREQRSQLCFYKEKLVTSNQMNNSNYSLCSFYLNNEQKQSGLLDKADQNILVFACSYQLDYEELLKQHRNDLSKYDLVISAYVTRDGRGLCHSAKCSHDIMALEAESIPKSIDEAIVKRVTDDIKKKEDTFLKAKEEAFRNSHAKSALEEVQTEADAYFSQRSCCFPR